MTANEYLQTSFEHDADFVDGRLEERHVGEIEHGKLQRKLLLLLSKTEFEPSFLCIPELRVQVAAQRFRVPDLCLIAADQPEEKVALTAPMLCIEILSPEDTMSRTLVRVRDFLQMGVPQVWVFDPVSRIAYICTQGQTVERRAGSLMVPGTDAAISVLEVFSALDKRRSADND